LEAIYKLKFVKPGVVVVWLDKDCKKLLTPPYCDCNNVEKFVKLVAGIVELSG
jgi:hypothetical protein